MHVPPKIMNFIIQKEKDYSIDQSRQIFCCMFVCNAIDSDMDEEDEELGEQLLNSTQKNLSFLLIIHDLNILLTV